MAKNVREKRNSLRRTKINRKKRQISVKTGNKNNLREKMTSFSCLLFI